MQETDNLKLARAIGVLSSDYSMHLLAHAAALDGVVETTARN